PEPDTEPETMGLKNTDEEISGNAIFEHFVQKVPVSMYIMAEGKFLYVNECLCGLLNYTQEDFLSGKILLKDIIHPEDLPEIMKRITDLVNGQSHKARYR